jgi:hypothetical protein
MRSFSAERILTPPGSLGKLFLASGSDVVRLGAIHPVACCRGAVARDPRRPTSSLGAPDDAGQDPRWAVQSACSR